MSGIDAMLLCLAFLFVSLSLILALSELAMWIEDRTYEDAEDGGDWMDV